MLKKMSGSVFCCIVYAFSSFLLILSLLVSIRMTALWDEYNSARSVSGALKEENAMLLSQYESAISLESIEEYAVTQLGMCACTNEQIEYIYLK